jgi:hypothetical protein
MKEIKDDLAHIRSMMERSSMFVSLSGLAGVLVGVLGLMAVWWIKIELEAAGLSFERNVPNYLPQNVFTRLVWAGLITLTLSLVIAFFLTKSKLRKQNTSSWDRAIKTVASLLLIDKSVYIWGFAFGVLHIVYGGLMYVKYK